MKILYVASEAVPFIASGGLADVAGSLPKALINLGHDCRVILPLYSDISPELRKKARLVTSFSVPLGWRNQYCGMFMAQVDGVTYYLLDNEYYFKREGIYGFFDDAERFAFFSKAVCESIQYMDFTPDILHCNDWQTALVPTYLNAYYRSAERLRAVRTVFTIHNIQYQGKYGMELLGDLLGLPEYTGEWLGYDGCLNFMKGAIEQSDMISTVSPTYANEILDPWFGQGLDRILRERQYKLQGILNGIDTARYDPQTDKSLFAAYTVDSLEGKYTNKAQLQRLMGLGQDPDTMLISIVSRLVSHKGLDLVKYIFDELIALDVAVLVLGAGDYIYENFFCEMAAKYPGKVAVKVGFIPDLAQKIYAGSDAFLMPSKSEPCGLSQMVALRYGTIPIVRTTGGLRDSITDLGEKDGNGFTFASYNAHDMLSAIQRCKALYDDRAAWQAAVQHAMRCDFSWGHSAGEYAKMYKRVMG